MGGGGLESMPYMWRSSKSLVTSDTTSRKRDAADRHAPESPPADAALLCSTNGAMADFNLSLAPFT